MKKYFLFSVLILSVVRFAAAAPRMEIVPQTVAYGERVQLILSDDKPIQSPPDLSLLQDDFVIRGQQQAENTTIINGVRTETHQLILSLFPKKKGTLTVGPLDWNGAQLPAQTINVTEHAGVNVSAQSDSAKTQNKTLSSTNDSQTQASNRIFSVEATVMPATIYIGESALYTIRLTENIGLTQAQIQTPQLSSLTLVPFGQDKIQKTTVNGVPVRVYERSFLLTPTAAGTLDLSGAGVLGFMPDTSVPRSRGFGTFPDFFGDDDFFGGQFGVPQKEVYAAAQNVRVTVQPKPADWQGWWLPSSSVSLQEQYKMPEQIYVGQPIERYVLLTAQGVDGNKLPLIVQPVNQGIQAYANPEKRMVSEKETGPVGVEEIMFVILPTQAGEITIPAIRVDWFNTRTHQKEVASLPDQTIQVLPAGGSSSPQGLSPTANPDSASNVASSGTPAEQGADSANAALLSDPAEEQTVAAQPAPLSTKWEAFKKVFEAFGIFELCLTAVVLAGLSALVYILRRQKRKNYLYQEMPSKKRQNKKPLPDLYPFE